MSAGNRPAPYNMSNLTKPFNFMISPELAEELREVAAASDLKQAQIIRSGIKEKIAELKVKIKAEKEAEEALGVNA